MVFAWEAFATDGQGNRTMAFTLSGAPTPRLEDEYLLFLVEDPGDRSAVISERTTHELVSVVGIMRIVDRTIASDTSAATRWAPR
ncbi:MAG: hypothetical protein ACR2JP_06245 [Acidimicrobiia bacterium]